MSNYFVENIERITEQTIEQEILAETEAIRVDAIDSVTDIKDDALAFIENQKKSVIETGDSTITTLNEIDSDTNTIYENTVSIAKNTEDEIEDNIRTMISENGYVINISDDGCGNVVVELAEVM